jgi:hypothetical protein
MRVVWSLIVAWCMVAAAAPRGPHDEAHHAGVSKASAYHHPLRHRELRSVLAPFVEPARTELVVPRVATPAASVPVRALVASSIVTAPRARGPPQR